MGPPRTAPSKKAVKAPEDEPKKRQPEKKKVVEKDTRSEEVENIDSRPKAPESSVPSRVIETIPENPFAHITVPRTTKPAVVTPDRGMERQRRIQTEPSKAESTNKEKDDAIAEEFVEKLFSMPIDVLTKDLMRLSKAIRVKIGKKLRNRQNLQVSSDKSSLVLQLIGEANETPSAGPERQLLDLWNVYNVNVGVTEEPVRTTALYQPIAAPLKEPKVGRTVVSDRDGGVETIFYVSDPYEDYVKSVEGQPMPARFKVAPESKQLKVVEPLINGKVKAESILDGGSMIVTMSEVVAREADLNWNPDIVIQVESANQSVDTSLGLAENVPFRIGSIVVYLQVHIIRNAAYDVLLGRPFDCITQLVVQNSRDGAQLITLTDPNDGNRRLTVPTQERRARYLQRESPVQGFPLASRI